MTRAFVFPSWIEGFGIPLLEAMTCGAPVIASDRGAIPEVVGNAALLMDAEDDEKLAGYLRLLLENPEEGARWRARGFERAAQFAWPTIGRQVLGIYERVLASPRRR
jgi:glycosyltransferase involved in cell wall biosynthesis